jgi:hypothetical protein
MNLDDRYQYQSRLVRACRWLRWKPLYWILASYVVIKWLIIWQGKIPADDCEWFSNRSEYVKILWRTVNSVADMKMKHCFTFDEILIRCKAKV